jgi:hypothetical protein
LHQRAEELTGQAGRHRPLGHEGMYAIEAENQEYEAKQDTGDVGSDLHG